MKQVFCIGNYSSKGIPCLIFNNGIFEPFSSFSKNSNASYLIKNTNFIYYVVENSNGMAYSYHIENSLFFPLNHCSSSGKSPCHLAFDNTRNILYIANYEDGSFSVFKINSNGTIGKQLWLEKFEKDVSHIHFISLSQDNNHLFVIDLGTNKIHAYKINTTCCFSLQSCSTFSFPPNTQPRHLAIDLDNRIHIITEQSCEIYTLSYIDNHFSFLFKTSLLPNSLKEINDTGCAIKISKNNFLYASLRGQNLIGVFEILKNRLNLIQHISCSGSIPRDIAFDRTENYLICANQGSDNLGVFSISDLDGKLCFKSTYSIEKPSCLLPI